MGIVQQIIKREPSSNGSFTSKVIDFKEKKGDVVIHHWVNNSGIHNFMRKLYGEHGGTDPNFVDKNMRLSEEDFVDLAITIDNDDIQYRYYEDWDNDVSFCSSAIQHIERGQMVYYRARGD